MYRGRYNFRLGTRMVLAYGLRVWSYPFTRMVFRHARVRVCTCNYVAIGITVVLTPPSSKELLFFVRCLLQTRCELGYLIDSDNNPAHVY